MNLRAINEVLVRCEVARQSKVFVNAADSIVGSFGLHELQAFANHAVDSAMLQVVEQLTGRTQLLTRRVSNLKLILYKF